MQATLSRSARPAALSHERKLAILGVLIVACMVSTTAHYTHNYLEIAHYPKSSLFSDSTVRLGIVIAWPLLTAIGVLGFWLYARGRYVAAYPPLALYSLLGHRHVRALHVGLAAHPAVLVLDDLHRRDPRVRDPRIRTLVGGHVGASPKRAAR